MAAPVRLAILGGTGHWGAVIAKTLREDLGARAQIVTIVGSEAGARHDHFWQDTLDQSAGLSLDAVVVASVPHVHAPQVALALDRGLPVFVEKPLTLSAVDAAVITEAARRAGRPVLVDLVHLFSPAYRALKSALVDLEITRLVSWGGGPGPVRTDWPTQEPALWDYAPHELAFVLDIIGPPAAIRAERAPLESGAPTGARNYALTHDGLSARALSCCGSGFAKKRRQLQVWARRGPAAPMIMHLLDAWAREPLLIGPKPDELRSAGLLPAVKPLTAALTTFLDAVGGESLALDVAQRTLDQAAQSVTLLECCSSTLSAESAGRTS